MEEVLVPLGFFALVAYIAKLIRDTRVRRKALESPLSEEKVDAFLRQDSWGKPSTRSALKWGLVVVALGMGLLIVDLFTISFDSPFAYAVLLLTTGFALLGYYLIERDDTPEQGSAPTYNPSPSESTREADA